MKKKITFTIVYLVVILLVAFKYSLANNVSISDVILVNQNTSENIVNIKFNIQWYNSWRVSAAPANYDAVWLFAKFKDGSNEWKHITISNNNSDHNPATGTSIEASSDGKGVFLFRSSLATGTFTSNGNTIQWNYGIDGVDDADLVTIKLFAIEMVYVTEGSYYAGSDTTNSGDVNALFRSTAGVANFFQLSTTLVDSIVSLGCGVNDDDDVLRGLSGNTGIGIDGDNGLDTDNNGSINNSDFPTGYRAFYIMKHELSQIQCVEFLNTLTRTQQDSRTASQSGNDYALTGSSTVSASVSLLRL